MRDATEVHDITAVIITGRPSPLYVAGYNPGETRRMVEGAWQTNTTGDDAGLYVYTSRAAAEWSIKAQPIPAQINPAHVAAYIHARIGT